MLVPLGLHYCCSLGVWQGLYECNVGPGNKTPPTAVNEAFLHTLKESFVALPG